tara:strand:- start:272 stop:529 length:258 start_codon:yes stop_codon:yes gene_type:complete
MIFITVSQRGYTDSTELLGPFQSIEEGKRLVTDDITRGLDGDETRYTFIRITNDKITNFEIGYVLFRDEFEHEGEDLKEEYFPNV